VRLTSENRELDEWFQGLHEAAKDSELLRVLENMLLDNAYLASAPLIAVTELPTTPTKEST
jgi:hypothetical protein